MKIKKKIISGLLTATTLVSLCAFSAEAVHIERSAYTKWENDNYEPTFAYIRELAKTLEVDYNFLFYDDSKTF